jgi:hypothetical protein
MIRQLLYRMKGFGASFPSTLLSAKSNPNISIHLTQAIQSLLLILVPIDLEVL